MSYTTNDYNVPLNLKLCPHTLCLPYPKIFRALKRLKKVFDFKFYFDVVVMLVCLSVLSLDVCFFICLCFSTVFFILFPQNYVFLIGFYRIALVHIRKTFLINKRFLFFYLIVLP